MSLLDACRRTARRTFGIERLRREQESAMLAILDGRDALVALAVLIDGVRHSEILTQWRIRECRQERIEFGG